MKETGMSELHAMWFVMHPRGFPAAAEMGGKPHVLLFEGEAEAEGAIKARFFGWRALECNTTEGATIYAKAKKGGNGFAVVRDGGKVCPVHAIEPIGKAGSA